MILTKINRRVKTRRNRHYEERVRNAPQELKDVVKDNAPKLYQPPIKTQVSVDVSHILGVSEIEKDTVFCKKYGVESYFRVWVKNGLSWYVDGSLEPCHYEELLMRLNH